MESLIIKYINTTLTDIITVFIYVELIVKFVLLIISTISKYVTEMKYVLLEQHK